jgi:ComF family protein
MHQKITHLLDALLHLAFPHVCEGCGSDNLDAKSLLCLRCLAEMPATEYHLYSSNPIEKLFWGRLPLTTATAQYYFTKQSLMQHLLHQLKYKSNQELGRYLGQLMGHELNKSNRYSNIDALVPLPLHPEKERKRGYNQAFVLCQGMGEAMKLPVWKGCVMRTEMTETQTKKGRVERWQNMDGKFLVTNPVKLVGKHLLLVDDVITTGATLEACGRSLLEACSQLSVAALCFSSH